MKYMVVFLPVGDYSPVVRFFSSLNDLDSVVSSVKSLFSGILTFSDFVVYSHDNESDFYATPLEKEVN